MDTQLSFPLDLACGPGSLQAQSAGFNCINLCYGAAQQICIPVCRLQILHPLFPHHSKHYCGQCREEKAAAVAAKSKERVEADSLRASLKQADKTIGELQRQLKEIREGSDPREHPFPCHLE